MTLRQALSAIRRRWYVVIAVLVLSGAVAGVFLRFQTPVYQSSITLRLSALATTATNTGLIGTAAVDFDPAAIATLSVLGPAAKRVGESSSSTPSWNVTYTVTQGQGQNSAPSIAVLVQGATASLAERHAAAVGIAYRQYLDAQLASARTVAENQVARFTAVAQAQQAIVNRTPTDALAQANLASAITALGNANTTIQTIDNAGAPLVVSKAAGAGVFQGTAPALAIAVALIAGLVAGFGLVLIADAFDDRLRDEADIEALTGFPSLGGLAYDRRLRRRKIRLPAAERSTTPLTVGLRSLRTTIQVLLTSGKGVVVLTSVEPGEGKTFIASNLAVVWARAGKRVVLVGGDLRRPGLGTYFPDAVGGTGLTDLLERRSRGSTAGPIAADVAAHLQDTEHPGLRVLSSGTTRWDPADLLATETLGSVIAALRAKSDIVIIDSPPALALPDSSLFAAHADGVVVVASVRRTLRRQLLEALDVVRSSGAVVLGVLANRSQRGIPQTYSAYFGTGGDTAPVPSHDSAAGSAESASQADGASEADGTATEHPEPVSSAAEANPQRSAIRPPRSRVSRESGPPADSKADRA